ncbi:exonuclease [Caudoviricetes sp.]|nr:exonuclease [Caudoviricetes sp.]
MIHSSQVAAILGLDPNQTRNDMLRQMVRHRYGMPLEFHGTIATQWGVIHLEEALEDFQRYIGKEVVRAASMPSVLPWLNGKPVGFIGDDEIVEIRCPFGIRDDVSPEFKTIDEQPGLMAKIQTLMFITGRQTCHLWQWTPYNSAYIEVPYDASAVAQIIPELEEFFTKEYAAAVLDPGQYLEEERKIIDTPRALQMVAEYEDLIEAIEKAEERKKELLAEIVKVAREKNAVFGNKKLTKVEKAGSISYAQAIKVLAPGANLEPWRGKPSSYWVLK